MKQLILLVSALFFFQITNAQKKEWPEKDAFHKVMSTTFHPSEEGNLEPIKTRSGEMVTAAKAWMDSKVPEGFEQKGLKKKLKLLYKESIALDKMIKKGATDDQIKKSLSALHDRFHQIVELCMDKH